MAQKVAQCKIRLVVHYPICRIDGESVLGEAAEKVECFFSPENLIIEMIPDFVLFGIIFSILARLFLSKCAF